jgi:hypothetical protein
MWLSRKKIMSSNVIETYKLIGKMQEKNHLSFAFFRELCVVKFEEKKLPILLVKQ